ncbi:uncharacterized protein [Anabrus simplex]|uniref:uncharacterized protein n=1 Tax=Anabrus simplex TaxID=316456 RepID=UPI0034DCDE45
MKMASSCIFQLTLIALLVIPFVVNAKPVVTLDAVDSCIFTCDYCFKEEIAFKCANECLDKEGIMDEDWHRTCPFFGQAVYVD